LYTTAIVQYGVFLGYRRSRFVGRRGNIVKGFGRTDKEEAEKGAGTDFLPN
jgi:hypothetical protein